MNEWGFIGQDIFARIGKSATSYKFKSRRVLCARREVNPF